MDKVLNSIKINESLDSFGTEMSSRTRIKTHKIQHFVHIEGDCQCSYGFSGVIHLIGHIFMMQMDSYNFGF